MRVGGPRTRPRFAVCLLVLCVVVVSCTGSDPVPSSPSPRVLPTASPTPKPLPSGPPTTLVTTELRLEEGGEDNRRFATGWRMFDTGEDALGGDLRLLGGRLLLHHQVPYGSGQGHSYRVSSDGSSWNRFGGSLSGEVGEGGAGVYSFADHDGSYVAAGAFHQFGKDTDYEKAIVFASSDGSNWRRVLDAPRAEIYDVLLMDGRFVAPGSTLTYSGGNQFGSGRDVERRPTAWVSTDGVAWRRESGLVRSFVGFPHLIWRDRLTWVGDGYPEAYPFSNRRSRVFVAMPKDRHDRTVSILGDHIRSPNFPPNWSIAANEERLVALAAYGSSTGGSTPKPGPDVAEAWTSRDGRRWKRCAVVADDVARDHRFYPVGVVAIDGGFLAVSSVLLIEQDDLTASERNGLWTSKDGCRWRRVVGAEPAMEASAGLDGVIVKDDIVFVLGALKTDRMVAMKGEARRLNVWRWTPN
jgi:hypothetical protein